MNFDRKWRSQVMRNLIDVLGRLRCAGKLAPLFCKRSDLKEEKKMVEYSPVVEKSRRLFLESGVPESVKKKMKGQKRYAANSK